MIQDRVLFPHVSVASRLAVPQHIQITDRTQQFQKALVVASGAGACKSSGIPYPVSAMALKGRDTFIGTQQTHHFQPVQSGIPISLMTCAREIPARFQALARR
jgi:hypothetical protein